MCFFLEPTIFGEAKSTDSRAMGSWTHGHDFEKCVFSKPLPRTKSAKKGVRKNSHAFCHGRAESISPAFFPAVFYPAVSPQRGLTIYLSKKGKKEYLSCCVSPTGAHNYLSKKGIEETLASCAAVAQLAFEMQNNGATVFEH